LLPNGVGPGGGDNSNAGLVKRSKMMKSLEDDYDFIKPGWILMVEMLADVQGKGEGHLY
jgi:hypothetical protein